MKIDLKEKPELKWVTYKYKQHPKLVQEYCQAPRHLGMNIAASHLQTLINSEEEIVIRQAWFTCLDCSKQMRQVWYEDSEGFYEPFSY